jgi:hypothetical protein
LLWNWTSEGGNYLLLSAAPNGSPVELSLLDVQTLAEIGKWKLSSTQAEVIQ